jgi:hypothetical protein
MLTPGFRDVNQVADDRSAIDVEATQSPSTNSHYLMQGFLTIMFRGRCRVKKSERPQRKKAVCGCRTSRLIARRIHP